MSVKAAYSMPPRETPATIREVISVKTALTELLAQEAIHMDSMQISEVGQLQDQKLKLTGLLERYMRYLKQHPEVLLNITQEEKTSLQDSADRFHHALKQNYDTLLVARAVNGVVVKCVTRAVASKDNNPTYDAHGDTITNYRAPISVTLNQTI